MPVKKSLNQILKSLTPVGRADSVYEVASAERINSIQEALHLITRGDHIVAGHNVRKRTGDGYVVLNAARSAIGGRGAGRNFPFKITVKTTDQTGTIVKIAPGTINGMLPSNTFETFPIGGFDLTFPKLNILTDGIQPIGVSLAVDADQPDPIGIALNMAPQSFSILLGVIVDKAPFQIVDGLLQVSPQNMIFTDRQDSVPGEPSFDYNYSWSVSQY